MKDAIRLCVCESRGRKMLPKNRSFSPESREADDDELRHESEVRDRERRGTMFIPIEEVPDPDSFIDPFAQLEREFDECLGVDPEDDSATEPLPQPSERLLALVAVSAKRHPVPVCGTSFEVHQTHSFKGSKDSVMRNHFRDFE